MPFHLPPGIADATRLTRAGRLADATAALQRALRGRPVSIANGDRPSATPADQREWLVAAPLARLAPASLVGPTGPTGTTGRFLDEVYHHPHGTRGYKLYLPSGYHGQAVPLLVMLHGCTQDATDFAVGTRMNALADAEPCLVLYPEQARIANSSKCWNWFEPAHQHRGRGEPALIAGLTQQVTATYRVDGRRIYVVGLSAGGAMATILGAAYPDLYAAVGVHSGLACGAAHDLPSALAAMRRGGPQPGPGAPRRPDPGQPADRVAPLILFQGDHDTTVHPRNADRVLAQWVATYAMLPGGANGNPLQVATVQGQTPGGHAFTRAIYRDTGGQRVLERWLIHGAGHAWSGGDPSGSFTDPKGPDASHELWRFCQEHCLEAAGGAVSR